MNILLVPDSLFSPEKPKVIFDRFVSKCNTESLDALCIAESSSQYSEQIEKFKLKQGGKYPIVYGNNIDLRIYDEKYPLSCDGIQINDTDTIYAMDDAVCEIEFIREANPKYQYIPLDVFMNMKVADIPVQNRNTINGMDLLNGKPIAIPLQKFIDMIEENMDEETKERLKKAKQEYNEKTKS